MSPQEVQIHLDKIAGRQLVVSLGSLCAILFGVYQITALKTKAENYLNSVVLISDFREWEHVNAQASPPLIVPVPMDTIHRQNHDTRPTFK